MNQKILPNRLSTEILKIPNEVNVFFYFHDQTSTKYIQKNIYVLRNECIKLGTKHIDPQLIVGGKSKMSCFPLKRG